MRWLDTDGKLVRIKDYPPDTSLVVERDDRAFLRSGKATDILSEIENVLLGLIDGSAKSDVSAMIQRENLVTEARSTRV